jgi:hypothetical protein
MGNKLQCRVILETVFQFEVMLYDEFIRVHMHHDILEKLKGRMTRVEEAVTHPNRYGNPDDNDPWCIYYTGEFDKDELDRLLPTNWIDYCRRTGKKSRSLII